MKAMQWGLIVIGTGLAGVSAPLSALFFLAFAATLAADVAPEFWQQQKQKYLPAPKARKQLASGEEASDPQPGYFARMGSALAERLAPGLREEQPMEEDEIDEDEDRVLAQTMLNHRRQRAASGDPQAVKELRRVEQQVREVYPDLLEGQPAPRIVMPDAFDQALATASQPSNERDPLLQTLEAEPHRLIIGRSRGGKTTLIHEMATHWADEGARVIVCDPDAMPGLWPGCTVVGAGNKVAEIEKVLKVTAQEYQRRQEARGQGQVDFRPIHVVIDEAHEVLPVIDGGLKIFNDLTRRGAKHGIHLTIGVQDKQVSTLGLQGQSELLKNFIVADVLKDSQGQRKAVIADAVTGKRTAWQIPQMRDPMSLVKTPAQPKAQTVNAARVAAQPEPTPVADSETERLEDPLLAGLLASAPPKQEAAKATITSDGHTINVYASATAEQPTKAKSQRRRTGTGYNVKRRVAAIQSTRHGSELEQRYAELHSQGVKSFRQAYKIAGGSHNDALAIWRKLESSKGVTTTK